MAFELLFEKGEEIITGIEVGSKTYTISLKISNINQQGYDYQLLLFKSSLKQSLLELVKYALNNDFLILQRDAILVEATEENIRIYDLDIEIKDEEFRKAGTLFITTDDPEDISTYQTKFFFNFTEFDSKRRE